MANKLKLYTKYGEKIVHKSFLDELNRYVETSVKIELNTTKDLAFLSILKFVMQNFTYKKDLLNITEGDILIDNSNNNFKYLVIDIDYDCYEFSLSRSFDDNRKIWYGFQILKESKKNTKFNYFEGYMSAKANTGLPKILSDFANKRSLKEKALKMENTINKSLLK